MLAYPHRLVIKLSAGSFEKRSMLAVHKILTVICELIELDFI